MENKVKGTAAGRTVATPKKIHGINLNKVARVQPDAEQKAKYLKGNKEFKKVRVVTTSPATDEPQVFSASVNVFGKTDVPAHSVVKKQRNDVMVAFAKDNFTFDQIFKDFVCDNSSLFVFDDVKIRLAEKQEGNSTVNEISFTGTLQMDKEPLNTLKDFPKCDTGLVVKGNIETSGEDITEKISPSNVKLASVVTFLLALADGIILQSAVFNVELAKVNDSWTFTESVTGKLQITKLGNMPVELETTVTYSDGKLNVMAAIDSITGLFGVENLLWKI